MGRIKAGHLILLAIGAYMFLPKVRGAVGQVLQPPQAVSGTIPGYLGILQPPGIEAEREAISAAPTYREPILAGYVAAQPEYFERFAAQSQETVARALQYEAGQQQAQAAAASFRRGTLSIQETIAQLAEARATREAAGPGAAQALATITTPTDVARVQENIAREAEITAAQPEPGRIVGHRTTAAGENIYTYRTATGDIRIIRR